MKVETADRRIVRGVGAVARALGVSNRTARRLRERVDPRSRRRHPLGELMFEEGGELCIELRAVEAYFNQCRQREGLRPIAPISPIWGKAPIARRLDIAVSKLLGILRSKDQGAGGDPHPLSLLIWTDPASGKPVMCENEYLGYLARRAAG